VVGLEHGRAAFSAALHRATPIGRRYRYGTADEVCAQVRWHEVHGCGAWLGCNVQAVSKAFQGFQAGQGGSMAALHQTLLYYSFVLVSAFNRTGGACVSCG
jgi:hypothetical protein